MRRFNYDKQDVIDCLHDLGVTQGDVIFSHVSLLNIGFCQSDPIKTIIEAFREVLGSSGSFLTPAYSYSFCKNQSFDPQLTKSDVGAFSNALLKEYSMRRSEDPIFSVVGFGPHIDELFCNLPPTSFGPDCLYERLETLGAKVCNIGLSLFYLTPIHYVEQSVGVPYRFNKYFPGEIVLDGTRKHVEWEYYARYLTEASEPNCSTLEREGVKAGVCKIGFLGVGEVHLAPMPAYFDLARSLLREDPWFIVNGPPFTPMEDMK